MRAFIALFLLIVVTGVRAADVPASETSIKELIEVTHSKGLMDGVMAQLDSYMQATMRQAAGGKKLTTKEQAIMDDMRKKIVTLFRSEMRWETIEPDLITIYQKSFTEKEITDLIKFYKTEAGQALINKMPIVMQNTMAMMQKRMADLSPKIRQIQGDAVEQIKASENGD